MKTPTTTWMHRIAVCALAIAIGAGGYMRLKNLGSSDLALEELNHLYVGRALAAGGDPVLPSGYWYTRGLEYTRLVELSSRYVDTPEVATRLPSAILGTLSLGVMAVGTWATVGPGAAVGATTLLAVYPEAVIQSRTGRFYMLQFLAGLIALFAGSLLLKDPGHGEAVDAPDLSTRFRRDRWRQILAASVAVTAMLFALRLQVTTAATILAFWLALALIGGRMLVRRGRSAWRWNVPLQLAGAGVLGGLVVVMIRPSIIADIALRAMSTPYWALTNQSAWYYLGLLSGYLPMVLPVGAASFLVLARERPRLSLYLLLLFAIPMLILSLVLPFKADRFALLAIPPLFIAIGAAVSSGSLALWAATSAVRSDTGGILLPQLRRSAAVLVAALPLVIALPSSGMIWLGYDRFRTPDWRAAGELLAKTPALAELPRGTTRSLPSSYYWGGVEFSVSVGHLERWDPRGASRALRESPSGGYVMHPPGTPDIYVGVPVYATPEDIISAYPGGVVIAIDEASIQNGMVDPGLSATLRREAIELCEGRCGSLHLYAWRVPVDRYSELGRGESVGSAALAS